MTSLDKFRTKISEGRPVFGVVLRSSETGVSELVAHTGLGFAWIGKEHSTLSMREVEGLVAALKNQDRVCLVRVPRNEANCLGKVVDMGADIVNAANVATPQQAEQVVRNARYYPAGRRSFSPASRSRRQGMDALSGERMREPNARSMVMLQIEPRKGMENLDRIARTKGVDTPFLGLGDLNQDLGIPGEFRRPQIAHSIERFSRVVCETGRIGAIPAMDTDVMNYCIGLGLRMISCAVDTALLREGLKHLRQRICSEVES